MKELVPTRALTLILTLMLTGRSVQRFSRCAGIAVLLVLSGCTLLLDPDAPQCEIDVDCKARGLNGRCVSGLCVPNSPCDGGACALSLSSGCATDESCAGGGGASVCWMQQCASAAEVSRFRCPVYDPAAVASVTLHMHVQELVSGRPPPGLSVAACRIQDVACQDPLVQQLDRSGTGDIALVVPAQFSGYLEVRAEQALPLLHYLTRPITEPVQLPTLVLIPRALAQASANAADIEVDLSANAVLIAGVRDCAGTAVEGTRFELEPDRAAGFFLVNGLPSMQATATVYDPALQQAAGGFLNVPPGLYLLTAKLASSGVVLDRYNVNVRSSTVTQVDFRPSQSP